MKDTKRVLESIINGCKDMAEIEGEDLRSKVWKLTAERVQCAIVTLEQEWLERCTENGETN